MSRKMVAIFLLALALRFFALILLGRHIKPEIWEYDYIALNLIQQNEYAYTHHHTIYRSFGYPLYPFLLAVSHFLTNRNYFIFEILQIVLSALTGYFVYLIAKKSYNEKTGLLASFLTATHPALIVYATKIHELTLVILLIAAVFGLIISLDWQKIHNNILAGALIGLGTLTRPSLIFLLPVYGLYLRLSADKPRNVFKPLFITFLTALLFIGLWTVRNYKIHKRFIFITTYAAENFWQGNNPFASGSALTKDGRPILDAAPAQTREQLYRMNEIEQYDFFYKESLEFIRSHPFSFIKMFFKKLFYFWWSSPQTGKLYPRIWTISYKLYYSVIFIFFILGGWLSLTKLSRINRAVVLSILLFFLLVSVLQSLYYVEMRHRWAVEPLMLVWASYGVTSLAKFKLKK